MLVLDGTVDSRTVLLRSRGRAPSVFSAWQPSPCAPEIGPRRPKTNDMVIAKIKSSSGLPPIPRMSASVHLSPYPCPNPVPFRMTLTRTRPKNNNNHAQSGRIFASGRPCRVRTCREYSISRSPKSLRQELSLKPKAPNIPCCLQRLPRFAKCIGSLKQLSLNMLKDTEGYSKFIQIPFPDRSPLDKEHVRIPG